MIISFMINNDPTNKINKAPALVTTKTGTLKEGSSFTDPVILIESAAVPSGNYVHIPAFDRYYYIRDIVNQNTNLWEVHLHVDVLKSYEGAIMSSPCIIAKTASRDFNLYLPDPNFKSQQNKQYGMQSFPNGFDMDDAHFYLTFFGKVV